MQRVSSVFKFYRENRLWHFIWETICLDCQSHFSGKKGKYSKVCMRNFLPVHQALKWYIRYHICLNILNVPGESTTFQYQLCHDTTRKWYPDEKWYPISFLVHNVRKMIPGINFLHYVQKMIPGFTIVPITLCKWVFVTRMTTGKPFYYSFYKLDIWLIYQIS